MPAGGRAGVMVLHSPAAFNGNLVCCSRVVFRLLSGKGNLKAFAAAIFAVAGISCP